ncbi:MAG: hypothetical protein AAGJ28_08140, partial [Pseudomonadota bacterium]
SKILCPVADEIIWPVAVGAAHSAVKYEVGIQIASGRNRAAFVNAILTPLIGLMDDQALMMTPAPRDTAFLAADLYSEYLAAHPPSLIMGKVGPHNGP